MKRELSYPISSICWLHERVEMVFYMILLGLRKQWVVMWWWGGQRFCSQRDIWRHFCGVTLASHVVETRDATEHPTMRRMTPTTKNDRIVIKM